MDDAIDAAYLKRQQELMTGVSMMPQDESGADGIKMLSDLLNDLAESYQKIIDKRAGLQDLAGETSGQSMMLTGLSSL